MEVALCNTDLMQFSDFKVRDGTLLHSTGHRNVDLVTLFFADAADWKAAISLSVEIDH